LNHKEATAAEKKAPIGPQPIDRISSPLIINFRFASERPWPSSLAHFLVHLLTYVYQNELAKFYQAKTRPETSLRPAITPRPQSFPSGKSGVLVLRNDRPAASPYHAVQPSVAGG
jgi:hypothetical protein